MRFEFATATRIVFGAGTLRESGPIAKELGTRALIVTGRNPHRAEPLLHVLRSAGLGIDLFAVAGEPEIDTVTRGTALARDAHCDLIISYGGGSALDAGKAIAAMLANEGDLLDFLEIIGRGKALAKPSAPFIAIPTTAGTGAEVTRNAVLASPEHRVKVSLRSPLMLAKVALIDPELTFDLPPDITASTGLDALTQLIEPYVCSRANPMTDALCREGIQRVARSLRQAHQTGHDPSAREDMSVASLFGGLALANAGLGAVHGFAGPIGGMFPAPHGAVCAALLPRVMAANLRALRHQPTSSQYLHRYTNVARWLTNNPDATADDGVRWVEKLIEDLHVARLGTYGITLDHAADLTAAAARSSSMKANPVVLDPAELKEILSSAL